MTRDGYARVCPMRTTSRPTCGKDCSRGHRRLLVVVGIFAMAGAILWLVARGSRHAGANPVSVVPAAASAHGPLGPVPLPVAIVPSEHPVAELPLSGATPRPTPGRWLSVRQRLPCPQRVRNQRSRQLCRRQHPSPRRNRKLRGLRSKVSSRRTLSEKCVQLRICRRGCVRILQRGVRHNVASWQHNPHRFGMTSDPTT
jgi:hypothetical protein